MFIAVLCLQNNESASRIGEIRVPGPNWTDQLSDFTFFFVNFKVGAVFSVFPIKVPITTILFRGFLVALIKDRRAVISPRVKKWD